MAITSKKSLISQIIYILIIIFITLLLFEYLETSKNLTFISIIWVLFLFSLNYFSDRYINIDKIIFCSQNINKLFLFALFLLFFVLISQNRYLNYESITWDISSYLVASNDLDNHLIPFSTQWESKGPLSIYLYYLFDSIANGNYVFFKMLNDLVILLISILLFKIVGIYTKNLYLKILPPILLVNLYSLEWYLSEFTEFYCLIFISFSNYLILKYPKNNKLILISSCLLSISTLINQGSIIFFIPLVIWVYAYKRTLNSFIKLLIGAVVPHLIFGSIYFVNGLFSIYLLNYWTIPLGYTSSTRSGLYELRVYLREIFEINPFIYLLLISLFFLLLFNKSFSSIKKINDWDLIAITNLMASLGYYFIAGHNYYHHYIYILFFVTLFTIKIHKNLQYILISTLLLFSVVYTIENSYESSIENISNINSTYKNYPLKELSEEITTYFIGKNEFTVLALDYVLVLHYLNKTNYSYIVHPANHFQEYIYQPLINAGYISKNEIVKIFEFEPDVIICNTKAIDNGGAVISVDPLSFGELVVDNTKYLCNLNSLSKKYIQIDTDQFRKSKNLSYYYDPYKEMNVFIKVDR